MLDHHPVLEYRLQLKGGGTMTGYGAGLSEPLPADGLQIAGVVTDLPAAVELWIRNRY